MAMHQDYCSDMVMEDNVTPSENRAGEIIVDRLLKHGHFGPLEHPQIVFNCGYFPHSVMQQARTHRIASFDVQSFRYTSEKILKAADGEITDVESAVYFRPVGNYTDRKGNRYEYTEADRDADMLMAFELIKHYKTKIERGMSEEHARGMLPFDYRQHFVVSFNLRALMHFLDMRYKKDAQLEIQQLCELMLPHFEKWTPAVYRWYSKNRLGKGRLAP